MKEPANVSINFISLHFWFLMIELQKHLCNFPCDNHSGSKPLNRVYHLLVLNPPPDPNTPIIAGQLDKRDDILNPPYGSARNNVAGSLSSGTAFGRTQTWKINKYDTETNVEHANGPLVKYDTQHYDVYCNAQRHACSSSWETNLLWSQDDRLLLVLDDM